MEMMNNIIKIDDEVISPLNRQSIDFALIMNQS